VESIHTRPWPIIAVVLGDNVWLTLAVEQGVVRTNIVPTTCKRPEHVSLEASASTGRMERFSGARNCLMWTNRTRSIGLTVGHAYAGGGIGAAFIASSARMHGVPELAKLARFLEDTTAAGSSVGPGSSPVLYKNLSCRPRRSRCQYALTALDKKTGHRLEDGSSPIDVPALDLKKSFVTPLVVNAAAAPS